MARSAFNRCVNICLSRSDLRNSNSLFYSSGTPKCPWTTTTRCFAAFVRLAEARDRSFSRYQTGEKEIKSSINSTPDAKLRVLNSFACVSMTINVFSINLSSNFIFTVFNKGFLSLQTKEFEDWEDCLYKLEILKYFKIFAAYTYIICVYIIFRIN